MTTMRRDGYVEVGSKCAPFESRIGLDEVSRLREFVLHDYFMQVPKLNVVHNDTNSKVSHAKLFPNKFTEDIDDVPSVFGSAMLKNLDPDTWRLVIMQTRTRRRSENVAQQRIVSRMNVEVMNDQIVEAVKKVQIVRGVGELTVESIEQQMDDESDEAAMQIERKAYERYMTAEDCDKAAEFLGKITRRLVAVG